MSFKTAFFVLLFLNLVSSVSESQELISNSRSSFNIEDRLHLVTLKPVNQYQFDDEVFFIDEEAPEDMEDGVSNIEKAIGMGAGAVVGFGVGHLIQGNWSESNGPIFTFGELGSAAVTWVLSEKGKHNAAIASFVVFGGLRVWEIIDLAYNVDWTDDTLSTVGITGAASLVLWKSKNLIGSLLSGDGGNGGDLSRQSFLNSGDDTRFILAPIQFEGKQGLAVGLELPLR